MSLTVPDFSDLRVLTIGDLMLDQYWFGPTDRISPEAPVPIVNISGAEARPGGAANVACNLASLGVRATLIGLAGIDANRDRLQQLLEAEQIEADIATSADRPTITKLRVLSRNQQLIRLDTEDQFDARDAEALLPLVRQRLPDASVCILSDYAKGTLSRVTELIELCRKHDVTVLVDPKGQDFKRYRGATVLTPNLAEFEAVVGRVSGDAQLADRGRELCAKLDIDTLVVTLSARGLVVIREHDEPVFLPARVREVFDVTGAGDTVIAVLGAALAAGQSVIDAAALANLAAGLVVRKIGVASVTVTELRLGLHEQGYGGRGLLERTAAPAVIKEVRNRGERVVMTNGCFDILHQGHVAYLEEAKALGDRLIVAVNDDASVTRIKGEGRPINPLADRMAVLAGLASVDWVVPFGEDTPAELIAELLPDVLVKGGDYKPGDIVGAEAVIANGGSVKVLGFSAGRSTSAIIEHLRTLT